MPTRILVVDDEPDLFPLIRQRFRREVRDGTYTFEDAGDGEEALAKLDKIDDIEIVLTDINMPGMDGLTLLSHLAKLERLLEAVVVTAYGDMENIRTAMNRGAFDFITKPIDLDDLHITIEKARQIVEQKKTGRRAREAFGRYLSDEIAARLLESPDALQLGGEKRQVTMLMSDIRGFSSISETMQPERVVEILNVYLGRMAEVITAFNGTIDEFIGDAILAIFGAPVLREDDALRGVACAVAMQLAMDDVNEELSQKGYPSLEMGIGINTGEVVVGNIGSTTRTKYGVVGSHVNLTSRVESYSVGRQILVTSGTLSAVGDPLVIGREMAISVKGYETPIKIHEVTGVRDPFNLFIREAPDEMLELRDPIAVRFTVLDGKHVTGDQIEAQIVELGGRSAILESESDIERLSNLQITFQGGEGQPVPHASLYAKVTETASDGRHAVRFTAVPEDVSLALARLSEQNEPGHRNEKPEE